MEPVFLVASLDRKDRDVTKGKEAWHVLYPQQEYFGNVVNAIARMHALVFLATVSTVGRHEKIRACTGRRIIGWRRGYISFDTVHLRFARKRAGNILLAM